MAGLVIVMAMGVVALMVVTVVWLSNRHDSQRNAAKQLIRAEALLSALREEAVEHAQLNEPFALVVLDEVRNYYRKKEIAR